MPKKILSKDERARAVQVAQEKLGVPEIGLDNRQWTLPELAEWERDIKQR